MACLSPEELRELDILEQICHINFANARFQENHGGDVLFLYSTSFAPFFNELTRWFSDNRYRLMSGGECALVIVADIYRNTSRMPNRGYVKNPGLKPRACS